MKRIEINEVQPIGSKTCKFIRKMLVKWGILQQVIGY